MKHIVVGTAGHIDHGKSTLVLALTGTDPDRLKEEKARGITIDLGFAHWEAPDLRVAFVDVPGHERFVKNMLAGAGGVDMVILVVAADESVMPQTREHFEICRLLQVQAGLVVLTKADLVDADMVELVRLEVRDLVRGSFLESAPIVAASSRTGAGLDGVRRTIVEQAQRLGGRATDGPVRLPVDRVFSMKGFGTVVTGTLVSGRLASDADVVALPGDRPVKVRGLQVHGETLPVAVAGQRVAVNVAGIDLAELVRGDVLATPGSLAATRVVDVRLELLPAAKPLRHGGRVRFHQGTTEVLGRVAVSGIIAQAGAPEVSSPGEVPSGRSAYVRLRFEGQAVLTRGDRFIVRAYSPAVTIAGGVVIDPQPPRGGIRTPAGRRRFARLDPIEQAGTDPLGDAADIVAALVDESAAQGLARGALSTRVGLTAARREQVQRLLRDSRRVLVIGDTLVSAAEAARVADGVLALLARHHQAMPLEDGVPREEARERLFAHAAPGLFEYTVDQLVAGGKIVARERLALASHRLALSPAEAEAKGGLDRVYRDARLAPPGLADVAATLGLSPAVVEKVAALLVRQKVLVRVDTLVFHHEALARLKQELAALKEAAGGGVVRIDVAAFKDRYGVSRKFAIPLLEHLDRERITRRVGDARVLL